MDPFTIYLIIAAVVVVVGLGIYEIRNWRKPGRSSAKLAAMDDAGVSDVRVFNSNNISGSGGFPGGTSI